MSSRPPSAPPRLAGYEYEKLLGSGGFADVFLYRQARPQRRVAIKVLLSTVLDDSVRHQFDSEANVMAQMSTHPSIVTIHQAEVSGDHRPYIVMEYCSRPNYGVRFRKERITVAEALRVGVQIAGAVETAHRAGILHRDIKPANILVTDYNRPALTDFGISIAAGQGEDVEDSQGMSIPWSPPEFFADPPRADVRSDVFSLAASVYSELNRALSIAMAKDPAGRYDTALAFGRALQQVELSLSLPVTQMDVLDDRGAAPAHDGEDDELVEHTRIRKVATVDPETGTSPGGRRRMDPYAGVAPALGAAPAPAGPASGGGAAGGAAAGARAAPGRPPPRGGPGSVGRAPLASEHREPEPERPRTPAWPFVTLAAVLVILLGVGATLGVRHFFVEEPDPIATTDINVPETPEEAPGAPRSLELQVIAPEQEGGRTGRVKVAWELPENFSQEDHFIVQWQDLPANYDRYAVQHEVHGRNSVVIEIPPQLAERCLTVRTVNPNGQSSEAEEKCLNG